MSHWKAAILLGVATALGVAWLLAVAAPVPMYPRRVARAWLGAGGPGGRRVPPQAGSRVDTSLRCR